MTGAQGAGQPPLAGVRVVAVEQYGAGPWCTLQLADMGAEVIKIEDPRAGGDIGRYVPPFHEGEDSLFFEALNRGKRSLSLDLRRAAGRAALQDLVRESDALFCNLRGDLPARMGLTYQDLAQVNERIVCCSLSGFGRTGPRASEPGYDYVIQGLAGWMSLTGDPDGPPLKSGLSLVDMSGGYVAALAILGGIVRARRDGVGCDCDVSLLETALAELMYVGTWAATMGYVPPRRAQSAHPSIVPFQNFRTSDGWLVVACPKEKFWRALCEVIGVPELLADSRFDGFAARDEHRDALVEILQERFLEHSTAEWLALLQPAGIASAPVNDVLDALDDPQVAARDALIEFDHPRFGRVRQVASPLRLSGAQTTPTRAPHRGEHTASVLSDICAYTADKIDELRRSDVIGPSVIAEP